MGFVLDAVGKVIAGYLQKEVPGYEPFTPSDPDRLRDIVMPGGLNGWDLSERVRVLRPAIKVLLTSGYPLNIEMAGTRPALSGDILGKPYSRAELARRVRAALDQPSASA